MVSGVLIRSRASFGQKSPINHLSRYIITKYYLLFIKGAARPSPAQFSSPPPHPSLLNPFDVKCSVHNFTVHSTFHTKKKNRESVCRDGMKSLGGLSGRAATPRAHGCLAVAFKTHRDGTPAVVPILLPLPPFAPTPTPMYVITYWH